MEILIIVLWWRPIGFCRQPVGDCETQGLRLWFMPEQKRLSAV